MAKCEDKAIGREENGNMKIREENEEKLREKKK